MSYDLNAVFEKRKEQREHRREIMRRTALGSYRVTSVARLSADHNSSKSTRRGKLRKEQAQKELRKP